MRNDVFLIQNTQNRDTEALQVKLDERELDEIRRAYARLARQAREELRRGGTDTGVPEVG